MNMLERHLKRIKKSESGNPEEDIWEEVTTLGEKLPEQILEPVPDRSIIVERQKKDNIEKYEEDAPRLKDQFKNIAQFAKFVKKDIQDKKTNFEKFTEEKKQFDKQIATLQPKRTHRFDLSKLNFKENKVEILKNELEILSQERDEIKRSIEHFTNQLNQSQTELSFKIEQMEDIELELKRIEKKEILRKKLSTEEEALNVIKKELSYVGNIEQTQKIFGTVNTIVDLLKSKNQSTQNELNLVKKEFQGLKEKYEKLMSQIK
jgi:chromosome segregation ATPase